MSKGGFALAIFGTTLASVEADEIGTSNKVYELHVPKITKAQLIANKTLLSGHWPYVVTDAMDEWPAMKEWAGKEGLSAISEIIPDEWVDYYPQNMYSLGNKPYLRKFHDVVKEFQQPSKSGMPRYMQMRLGLKGWEDLEKKMYGPKGKLPPGMWTEKDWIYDCMPDSKDIDNFFRVNQWNMMLIGEVGTGIFFHHDHLSASSWQAHIAGRKVWTLCPYTETHLLEPAGRIHTFDASAEEFPDFHAAKCGQVVVNPGEIAYYPSYWWHQTKCLDYPTVGVTGLMVGVEDNRMDLDFKVHEQFRRDIQQKCNNPGEDISKKWPGAAPPISKGACAAMDKCLELWDANFKRIDFDYSVDEPFLDHTRKAMELDEAGDIEGAVASFRAAARFQPDSPEAWNNLATALQDEGYAGRDSAEAKAEAKKASQTAAKLERDEL